MAVDDAPVLEICNLTIGFDHPRGTTVVVDDVSLAVPPSATVALVGESGCGKSLTALSVLRLIQPPGRIISGGVVFRDASGSGRSAGSSRQEWRGSGAGSRFGGAAPRELECDLLRLPSRELQAIRGDRIAMIFQEPMTALNPVMSIGEQVAEALLLHRRTSRRAARARAVELLGDVSLPNPDRVAGQYPHELSGGMRQRAMIAMALACGPSLLIADEPTTALDSTTQREILDLLRNLQRSQGLSLLMITHDLGVVEEVADYVYVMYAGRIVEHAAARDLFANPLHPYTQGLLDCTPRIGAPRRRLATIPGTVPTPGDWPAGCRFHPRCRLSGHLAAQAPPDEIIGRADGGCVLRKCVEAVPGILSGLTVVQAAGSGHAAACWAVP